MGEVIDLMAALRRMLCPLCEGKGYSEAMVWRAPAPPRPMRLRCSCCDGTGINQESCSHES